MDNLGSHKAKAVRHALRRVGALRRDQPRSREAVCNAIADALKTVSPTECSNYFAHAGYGAT